MFEEKKYGLDNEERRELWDMIKEEKNGSKKIIKKKLMDEEDMIGDSIDIMDGGEMKC
jgi:ABC-type multidrug transport system ATPase subunit